MTARSTAETKRLEPTGITVFRQADVGEYLREVSERFSRLELFIMLIYIQEDTLFTT